MEGHCRQPWLQKAKRQSDETSWREVPSVWSLGHPLPRYLHALETMYLLSPTLHELLDPQVAALFSRALAKGAMFLLSTVSCGLRCRDQGFPVVFADGMVWTQSEGLRWKSGHLGLLGGILDSDASVGAAQAVERAAAAAGPLSSRRGSGKGIHKRPRKILSARLDSFGLGENVVPRARPEVLEKRFNSEAGARSKRGLRGGRRDV